MVDPTIFDQEDWEFEINRLAQLGQNSVRVAHYLVISRNIQSADRAIPQFHYRDRRSWNRLVQGVSDIEANIKRQYHIVYKACTNRLVNTFFFNSGSSIESCTGIIFLWLESYSSHFSVKNYPQ
jgi:hypothetical protein